MAGRRVAGKPFLERVRFVAVVGVGADRRREAGEPEAEAEADTGLQTHAVVSLWVDSREASSGYMAV